MIDRLKAALLRKGFVRNVATLAGGVVAGQGLVLLATPILTRLYTPADFGILASFISISTMLSMVASLRLEQALPLPEDDYEAFTLLVLTGIAILVMTAVFSACLFLTVDVLKESLNSEQKRQYAWIFQYSWMIPVGIIAMGAYNIANMAAVRTRHFPAIAKTSVAQAIGQIVIQLALFKLLALGLLIGQVVGRFAGTGTLFRLSVLPSFRTFRRVEKTELINVLKRYKQFPLVSTWSSLMNSAGLLLPPLLILSFYGKDASGQFALGFRLISMPMMFLGNAIAQVYIAEAAKALRAGNGQLERLHNSITKRIFYSALCLVPIGALAPWLFPIVFGPAWQKGGWFVLITMVPLMGQMVVSPVSNITTITERLSWQFYGDTTRAVLVVLSLYLPHHLGASDMVAVIWYAIAMTFTYLGFWFMYHRCAKLGAPPRPGTPILRTVESG